MSLDARIETAIGALASGRVYNLFAPSGTTSPHIVWQRIVETPVNTHEATATLSQTLVQVSCYALDRATAKTLRDSVRTALEGNHAEGPISVDSVRDNYEDAAGLYRCDIDLSCWDGS